jgi:hypothetical protein
MSADGSAKRQGSPLEGARRGVVKASLFDDDSGDDATGFDTNDHEMESDGTNEDGTNDGFIHESGSPRNEVSVCEGGCRGRVETHTVLCAAGASPFTRG